MDKLAGNPTPGRTIAHELGHGAFRLAHSWVQYEVDEKSSDNLMDYTTDIRLWKPQWDWMHDPGMRVYGMQGVDEGAFYNNTNYVLSALLKLRPHW